MASNTAGKIAELRRQIASNKGKAARARATRDRLLFVIDSCDAQVRHDQREIEAMGGRVKR